MEQHGVPVGGRARRPFDESQTSPHVPREDEVAGFGCIARDHPSLGGQGRGQRRTRGWPISMPSGDQAASRIGDWVRWRPAPLTKCGSRTFNLLVGPCRAHCAMAPERTRTLMRQDGAWRERSFREADVTRRARLGGARSLRTSAEVKIPRHPLMRGTCTPPALQEQLSTSPQPVSERTEQPASPCLARTVGGSDLAILDPM